MEVCRDFLRNNCNNTNCTRIHDKDACRHYYLKGLCKFSAEECKFKHYIGDEKENERKGNIKIKKHNKQNKFRNTTCFTPNFDTPDMRVVLCTDKKKLNVQISPNDVLLVPNLLCERNDFYLYNKLFEEIYKTNTPENDRFMSWHEGCHFIINDKKINLEKDLPTFKYIINSIEKYFNLKTNAVRFNYYKDSSDWKAYHHDAAHFRPELSNKQNITIGISLGACRDASFENVKNNSVISFPQFNGDIYCFCSQVNSDWKHGILKLPESKQHNNGRISIILWGWIELVDYNDLKEIFIK
jgi:hypothetical protein